MEILLFVGLIAVIVILSTDVAALIEIISEKLGFQDKNTTTTNLDNKYTNQIAVVTKTILNNMNGKITYNGVEWLAKSNKDNKIKEGEKVKILNLEGTIMVVTNEIT